MLARPPPSSSAAFNSLSRSRLVAMDAGDEQLRDQFVLGAEMIIHRREIDVRLGDDVAQRHVAEAAIGIKPFGGGENGGPGLIARHGSTPVSGVAFQTVV